MRCSAPADKLSTSHGSEGKLSAVGREIKLDGGEISILKKIGLSGSPLFGKLLVERIEEMETGEFLDSLCGLIDLGYVLSNKVNIRLMEDVEKASFRVNPT